MEYLVIRLGASLDARINWIVWSDAENEIIASGTLADASELASLKSKSQQPTIIALAPSSELGFKSITLPNKSSRKVLQAVPFMLEEDVAQDISSLFFAFGSKQGNLQEVVYCDRNKLDEWQNSLQEADLFCDTLVPDILCLPYSEDGISVVQIDNDLLVRSGQFAGMQAEASWLTELSIKQAQANQQSIQAFSELSHLTDLNSGLSDIEQNYDALPMQLLLQGAKQAPVNLFQSEYAVKRRSTGQWQKWRVAAVLAGLAILTGLIDTSLQLNTIKQERASVRNQINDATKAGFPELGKVLNHRRMIAREVSRLEQGGGSTSMLNMLAQLSPVFSQSGVSPQSLRFDAKRAEIRMQTVARNFESLERFKREAEQIGFSVEQGAINNKGDQVTGALVIKG